VLGLERHQVVEHFFLSLGQGHQGGPRFSSLRLHRRCKASVSST
jgi:hypothetical protein